MPTLRKSTAALALSPKQTTLKTLAVGIGLTVAGFAPFASQQASAASLTWSRGVAGTFAWNNNPIGGQTSGTTNWTTGTAFPNAAGDIANVVNSTSATQTIALNQDITLGQFILSNAQTQSGGRTITSGTAGTTFALTFDNTSSDAVISQNYTGTMPITISTPVFIAGNGNLNVSNASAGSALTISGSVASALSSGTQTLKKAGAGTVTVSGVLSNGSAGGTLALTSTQGTLILAASNTYSGATTISAGTLQIGNGGATGSISTSSAIVNNGTLSFNRTNAVTQGTDFNGAAISGSGGVSQIGAGSTLTLNTTNSYLGTTTIGAGQNSAILRATASGALGSGAIQFDTGGNGSTARLELTSDITLGNAINFVARNNNSAGIQNISGSNTLTGNLALGTGGDRYTLQSDAGFLTVTGTFTPPASSNRTVIFAGDGNGLASGPLVFVSGNILNVTKSGAGAWTLSANSTYSGTTTVSAGTLNVSGTLGSTSSVTVAGGAVLDVDGAINSAATTTVAGLLRGAGSLGAVSVTTGTAAPGNSPGTLNTGDFTLASTAVLAFELQNGDTAVGGGINDLISVTGNLTLDGTLSITELGGSLAYGSVYRLFNYTGLLTNNTLDIDAGFLAIDGHTTSYIDTATSGQVNLVVVPEPGTFAMLFGGIGMLAMRRRRF